MVPSLSQPSLSRRGRSSASDVSVYRIPIPQMLFCWLDSPRKLRSLERADEATFTVRRAAFHDARLGASASKTCARLYGRSERARRVMVRFAPPEKLVREQPRVATQRAMLGCNGLDRLDRLAGLAPLAQPRRPQREVKIPVGGTKTVDIKLFCDAPTGATPPSRHSTPRSSRAAVRPSI